MSKPRKESLLRKEREVALRPGSSRMSKAILLNDGRLSIHGLMGDKGKYYEFRNQISSREKWRAHPDANLYIFVPERKRVWNALHEVNVWVIERLAAAGVSYSWVCLMSKWLDGNTRERMRPRDMLACICVEGENIEKSTGNMGGVIDPFLQVRQGVLSFVYPDGGPEPIGFLGCKPKVQRFDDPQSEAARIRACLGLPKSIVTADCSSARATDLEVVPANGAYTIRMTLIGAVHGRENQVFMADGFMREIAFQWTPKDGSPSDYLREKCREVVLGEGSEYAY